MRKNLEISTPGSCLNKASDSEMVFVLRAKDPASSETIRFWIQERIRQGLNKPDDDKIDSARECADIMDDERPYA